MTLLFHRIERKLVSWLDKRLSFFWISTLLLLIALGTTIVDDIVIRRELDKSIDWRTAWLKIASSTSTWLFTYLGLLLAVYSIKGLSDRPGNINEVLLRAADLLEEAPVHNRVVTLLCEYPAWGALTERTTTAYRRFVSVWENVLKEECNTRVVLVCPTLAGMEKYIRKYAKDYHSEDEIQAAIKVNRRMCNELLKDKSMSAFWPIDPPRYQVLIISDLRDKEVLHRNALLWFAPRSSEKVENVQGAQNEHAGSGAASVTGKYRAHVPVFAWKVIAPCDLEELFHTAVFFAEDSAQERRQIGIETTLTLGQFLSGIESNNL